jgi:uncharacterized membrane protein YbhN (UPF0104 family)
MRRDRQRDQDATRAHERDAEDPRETDAMRARDAGSDGVGDADGSARSRTKRLLRDHGVELTVVFGVLVVFALVVAADAEAVLAAFERFDWRALLAVVGLTTGGFVFRFWKWEYYLRHLGIRVPLATSALVFTSGLMMVITPMKGGGVWKGWLLNDTHGVPISRIVSVVVAERATDLLALSALAALGVVLYDRSAAAVGGVVAVFLAAVLLVQWRGFCLAVLERVGSLPLFGKLADPLLRAYEDSYALFKLRPLAVSAGLSLLAWVTEGMSLWVVLRGFDVPADPLAGLSIFGFGSVVGGVSMLPGGLGAAEASIAGLLVAFGYDRATAAGATIVVRVGTLWYGAALGTVGFAAFKLWRRAQATRTAS